MKLPTEICQNTLPVAPWMDALAARLPGLQPVAEGDWLRVDDAYAAQMAYRDQLLATRRDDVFMRHGAPDAAEALLLEMVEVGGAGPAGVCARGGRDQAAGWRGDRSA